MVIQHNMQAANANRMLGNIVSSQSKSTERLSSGYRINRAGDDAAGLAISEKMRGQIRGLDKASSNAQDGISLVQTAEGALQETQNILQRMRELAVQASNDTNTDDDRTQIQNEIDQLTQEVDRIANTTEFNSKKLLDGSLTGSVNAKDGKTILEGSFGNSLVKATFTTDNTKNASHTDVIRVEVMEDFTEGKSTASTKKLTDAQLDKLYTDIQGKIGATNSTDEAIDAAIDAANTTANTGLDDLKTKADTSTKATVANEKELDKFVDALLAESKKADSKNGLLAEGVTKEDVKAAVSELMTAWRDAEQTATNTPKVDAAEKALRDLFTTDAVTKVGTATAAVTGNFVDDANAAAAKNVAVIPVADDLNAAATKIVAGITGAVKDIVAVENTNKVNIKKVEEKQEEVDALSNNELAHAIYDYGKAKANLAGLTTPTDAAKAEAQAKVDEAKKKLDVLNTDKQVINVSDLFGSSESKDFEIGSKVADDGTLEITMTNKDGSKNVITIQNADKLKAGDILTITSEAAVESEPAKTGSEALRLQIGANAGQEMTLGINSMKASDLNIVQTKEGVEGKSLDVTSQANASQAVNAYDLAIQKVSTERAKMGAVQNRLEHTISNLDNTSENLQSAESSIRDVDMATEMVSYSKNNILQQAAQSMLAQANQSTQGVLSLLQ